MSLRRLVPLALLASCSACSFVGIRGPPVHLAARAPIPCTPSPDPARADLLFALGAGAGVAGLVLADEYRCLLEDPGCERRHHRATAAVAAAGVAFLFSSIHGFQTAQRCRETLDLQTQCQQGAADACLALTGGAGLALPTPEARPQGTQTAP